MNQDNKAHEPQAKESGGFLRRLFGRGGHEAPESDAHSRPSTRTALDLDDIQGFILRGYRMPMVRHFLLSVVAVSLKKKKLVKLDIDDN